jgi:hypothetical protein
VCTGDTYMTLADVLRSMGVLPSRESSGASSEAPEQPSVHALPSASAAATGSNSQHHRPADRRLSSDTGAVAEQPVVHRVWRSAALTALDAGAKRDTSVVVLLWDETVAKLLAAWFESQALRQSHDAEPQPHTSVYDAAIAATVSLAKARSSGKTDDAAAAESDLLAAVSSAAAAAVATTLQPTRNAAADSLHAYSDSAKAELEHAANAFAGVARLATDSAIAAPFDVVPGNSDEDVDSSDTLAPPSLLAALAEARSALLAVAADAKLHVEAATQQPVGQDTQLGTPAAVLALRSSSAALGKAARKAGVESVTAAAAVALAQAPAAVNFEQRQVVAAAALHAAARAASRFASAFDLQSPGAKQDLLTSLVTVSDEAKERAALHAPDQAPRLHEMLDWDTGRRVVSLAPSAAAYLRQQAAAARLASAKDRALRDAAAEELRMACADAARVADNLSFAAVKLRDSLAKVRKSLVIPQHASAAAAAAEAAAAHAEQEARAAAALAASAGSLVIGEAFAGDAAAAAARLARINTADAACVAVQSAAVGAASASVAALAVASAEARGTLVPCPLDDALFAAERSLRLVLFLDAASLRVLEAHKGNTMVQVWWEGRECVMGTHVLPRLLARHQFDAARV